MVEDWKNAKTAEELKTMTDSAKLTRMISLVIISTAATSNITGVVTTVSLNIYEIKQLKLDSNGSDITKALYFDAEYFYDVQNSPIYEIVSAMQSIVSIIAGMSFAAIDVFFIVLVLHLCGQLSNLKQLISDLPTNGYDSEKTFTEKLSMIVDRHNYLFR